MPKANCLKCTHCEYLHEYEVYMCNTQDHPLREEAVEERDECGFYEEYCEEEEIV